MPLIKQPKLQFNIRSFHPDKDFDWNGLMFEGDNRGFSNKPSGTGLVTSRIWHRFNLNPSEINSVSNVTRTDPSKADTQAYEGRLTTKGNITPIQVHRINDNVSKYRLNGHYGGVNQVMPGSTLQKNLGMSYVPTLNVDYKITVDVDRVNKHVDIVTYITGAGFPNCEAFVMDGNGKSIFLGVHVRKGAAPVSLALNLGYPMIASAVRIPINSKGHFAGTVGDELARRRDNADNLNFQKITDWNQKFLQVNPNKRHCMLLEKANLEECFN